MTPTRPYFLRAMYDWIVDNQCTPFLVVDATVASVQVPEASVEDGQIVLNIAPSAIANFLMDNDAVSFNARFSGTPFAIYVPMAAVMGLYASENGQGMAFPEEPAYQQENVEEAEKASEQKPNLSSVVDETAKNLSDSGAKASKKKPSLTVIK